MNLKGFFGKVGNAFKSVGKLAGSIFADIFSKNQQLSKEEKEIVEDEINKGTQKTMGLAAMAINAVNMVDNVVLGNKIPDEVVAALINIESTAEEIFGATKKFVKDGGRQAIAKEILLEELLDIVVNKKQEINLGYRVIKTMEEVLALPNDDLLTAVQQAKNIATRVGEKLKERSKMNK